MKTLWLEVVNLFRRRRVLQYLVGKELRVAYRNKLLGNLWALIEPMMILLVLYFVFRAYRHATPSLTLYLFAGVIGWDFFAKTVSGSAMCIRKYKYIIHKYPLPFSLYPLTIYFFRLNDLIWGLGAYVVMFLFFNHHWQLGLPLVPAWSPVFFVAWLAGYSAIIVGVGMIFARLGVLFHDMEHIANILMRAGFFLNPIFIEMHQLEIQLSPAHLKLYLLLNPLAGYLLYLRCALPGGSALLGGYEIPITHYPLILAAWSVGILGVGAWVFSRGSKHFAKYL